MNNLKKIYWILWKDAITQLRTREATGAMIVFALMVILIFAFSFIQQGQAMAPMMIPGMIWVTITFSGMLGLNFTFLMEKNNDALMGLLLAPLRKDAIYLGKVGAQFLFLLLVELFALPMFFIFFDIQLQAPLIYLLLTVLLGTLGFSGAGVFLAALSDSTRTRDMILPVVLFPILIPLLIGAVKASGIVIAGQWPEPLWVQSYWSWIRLMAVYDVIIFSAAVVLIDYVLEV